MAYVKAVDYKSSGNKKALWHTVAGIGIVLNYAMRGEKNEGRKRGRTSRKRYKL